jgi:hypothetical protein
MSSRKYKKILIYEEKYKNTKKEGQSPTMEPAPFTNLQKTMRQFW